MRERYFMKKMIMLILAMCCFVGCGPNLKRDGSFPEEAETFVGKFRGVSIYRIYTPNGNNLYLGVKEDESVTGVQTFTGKGIPVPVIIIDGETVSVERAKEILNKKEKVSYDN